METPELIQWDIAQSMLGCIVVPCLTASLFGVILGLQCGNVYNTIMLYDAIDNIRMECRV